MNPVGWFEIPVTDLDRAKEFYEAVFGFKLEVHEMGPLKMAWFPMKPNEPQATGSLVKADGYKPSHSGTLVYFSVNDIEVTLKKADDSGGKTLKAKYPIGEHGFVGILEDTEGNRVAIHSMK